MPHTEHYLSRWKSELSARLQLTLDCGPAQQLDVSLSLWKSDLRMRLQARPDFDPENPRVKGPGRAWRQTAQLATLLLPEGELHELTRMDVAAARSSLSKNAGFALAKIGLWHPAISSGELEQCRVALKEAARLLLLSRQNSRELDEDFVAAHIGEHPVHHLLPVLVSDDSWRQALCGYLVEALGFHVRASVAELFATTACLPPVPRVAVTAEAGLNLDSWKRYLSRRLQRRLSTAAENSGRRARRPNGWRHASQLAVLLLPDYGIPGMEEGYRPAAHRALKKCALASLAEIGLLAPQVPGDQLERCVSALADTARSLLQSREPAINLDRSELSAFIQAYPTHRLLPLAVSERDWTGALSRFFGEALGISFTQRPGFELRRNG